MPNALMLDMPSKKRSLLHERHYRLLASQIVFVTRSMLLVRPKTIVFGRTSVLRMMFFFIFSSNARSPRCVGRPAWNFARWSVLGPIL